MGAARVLIADDSPLVLRMIEKIVSGAGFETLTARDGLEAVELALTRDLELVILDVSMPRMNGYQACRLLKSEASTRHLPVIILTSKDQAGDRFWGLETGADYYVTKDADPTRILDLVKNVLSAPDRPRRGGPRPAPRGSTDVLARVNELLDRKLYEATILSEIGRVARSVAELDETFTQVMAIVQRVVEYTLGALAFVEGDELEVLLAQARPAEPPVVEEMKARLAEAIAPEQGLAAFSQVRARLFTPKGGPSGSAESTLDGFVAFPIRTGPRLAGLLALGGRSAGRLPPDQGAFLRQVANQAHIVTENSRLVQRLSNLAVRDGLTGLFNHRQILTLLEKECERASRYPGRVSAAMADIDHFKQVNDRYGHQAGDVVLREVAELLGEGIRTVDSLGRYGGEEFLVVLPETELEDAQALADRLRRSVAEHVFRVQGQELRLTLSFGVAQYPAEAITSMTDLIREADRALYRAKQAGRNRVG